MSQCCHPFRALLAGRVDGSRDQGDVRLGLESAHHFLDSLRMKVPVVVQVEDVLAPAVLHTDITSRLASDVRVDPDYANLGPLGFDHLRGTVVGIVVHDHDLDGTVRLGVGGLDGPFQGVFSVPSDDVYGNQRCLVIHQDVPSVAW